MVPCAVACRTVPQVSPAPEDEAALTTRVGLDDRMAIRSEVRWRLVRSYRGYKISACDRHPASFKSHESYINRG